jgi:hypothetical protein
MERLLPQDETSGKTKLRENILRSFLPSILRNGGGGGENDASDDKLHVKVRFGKEIPFDDLLEEHEKQYGKLWKYCGKSNAEEEYRNRMNQPQQHNSKNDEQTQLEEWNSSSEAERVLYSKIVRRIEYHLDDITKKVCKEGGE